MRNRRRTALVACMAAVSFTCISAQEGRTAMVETEKRPGDADYRLTWCNPLSLPFTPADGSEAPRRRRGGSLADPMVLRHDGRYHLYATGGQAWVSEDLVDWAYHPVSVPGRRSLVGPALVEAGGAFYLTDNEAILYRGPAPLGPWESLGRIRNEQDEEVHFVDWMFFPDEDGRLYAYHNSDRGIGTDGIFVTELDPRHDYARTLGPTTHCFAYDPDHVWEHRGDHNQDPTASWIEAGWMTRRGARYHLQYSAPGTEFFTYAVGAYTAGGPRGPFAYDSRSPLLVDGGGLARGPGHHTVFEGPDGELWTLYHVLFRNRSQWERRLAMDRVSFDDGGHMVFEGPTRTPQWAPASGRRGSTGLAPLCADRPAQATAASPDHPAGHAVDDSVNTWWDPGQRPAPYALAVDLGGLCGVHAVRLVFFDAAPFQYVVETSADGRAWREAADLRANTVVRNNAYHVLEEPGGRPARHLRLTVTGAPEGVPARLIDFAAFGRPATEGEVPPASDAPSGLSPVRGALGRRV
jgi:xylan 1,4-beta-xylosidase